jgi:hypothetical protein
MSRTLVLTVLLAAWLATGIIAGIVTYRRRHDRFPWWLLGVAFGPLLVPLALGAERREEPTDQATPPLTAQDRSVPALVAIDSGPRCHRRLAGSSRGADRRARPARQEGRMTMTLRAPRVSASRRCRTNRRCHRTSSMSAASGPSRRATHQAGGRGLRHPHHAPGDQFLQLVGPEHRAGHGRAQGPVGGRQGRGAERPVEQGDVHHQELAGDRFASTARWSSPPSCCSTRWHRPRVHRRGRRGRIFASPGAGGAGPLGRAVGLVRHAGAPACSLSNHGQAACTLSVSHRCSGTRALQCPIQVARIASVWTRSSTGSLWWMNSALWSRKRPAGPPAAKPAGGRLSVAPSSL